MYALRPLTVIFLPEKRAEAELAESVMKESRLGSAEYHISISPVCHLRTVAGSLVHLELGLVFAVDSLVGEETGSRDHRSGHTITNEDDQILGLFAFGQGQNFPNGFRLATVVVAQHNVILSRVVQLDVSVRLRQDVDRDLGSSFLREEVLVIGEVVRFDCYGQPGGSTSKTYPWGLQCRRR